MIWYSQKIKLIRVSKIGTKNKYSELYLLTNLLITRKKYDSYIYGFAFPPILLY